MSIFVIVSPECAEQAKSRGLREELERFKARVEKAQSIGFFDDFPNPYLVKKQFGKYQFRLIARRLNVDEHVAVIFLTIFAKAEQAYDDFQKSPSAYGEKYLRSLCSDDFAEGEVRARTRLESIPSKPSPTSEEYEFLFNTFSHRRGSGDDAVVYETDAWVSTITSGTMKNKKILVHDLVVKACEGTEGLSFTSYVGNARRGIWTVKRGRQLLLLSADASSDDEALKTESEDIYRKIEEVERDYIQKISRRAYPAIVLYDQDLWLELQEEQVANKALSPEETDVLESARGFEDESGASGFPLFINGRAGSGKSTVLQYLFADVLFAYLSKDHIRSQMAPPVYLTANGELLRNARVFVERLLKKNGDYVEKEKEIGASWGERVNKVLDSAFREFYPNILSMINSTVRSAKFQRAKRLDFTRFKSFFLEQFGMSPSILRDYSPELCWHVIRTFIKGRSSDGNLEPEDYIHLASGEKSVSDEIYKDIFEKIWRDWYKKRLTEEGGFWDDQDLVRYVLDSELVKSVHPAVFCDESQDFTRLELELILRLNLFSQRQVPVASVNKVCFAFAGDQFQTLNPTGFRWESTKSIFVEKFILEMDPSGRSLELNYRELKYNYRSSPSVVRFGNFVQALRSAVLDARDLRPQLYWGSAQKSRPVTWFDSKNGNFWKKYSEANGFVIILPCGENEEAEYVRNDPILKQHIRVESGVPLNVLSAIRAKGCEYDAVLVYGFGREAENKVKCAIENRREHLSEDDHERLVLEYFINRLYVAVSRPKLRLVVVDDDAGRENLWWFALEQQAENDLLALVNNGVGIWQNQIAGMIAGDANSLLDDFEFDPTENAKNYEREGKARRDGYLMVQAAQQYRIAGLMPRFSECMAWSHAFEGKFVEAGLQFVSSGFAELAGQCFLMAGREGFASFRTAANQLSGILNLLEFRVLSRLDAGVSLAERLPLMREIVANLIGLTESTVERDRLVASPDETASAWLNAFDRLLREGVENKKSEDIAVLRSVCDLLVELDSIGFPLANDFTAEMMFRAEKFDLAVRYGEASIKRPTDWLRRAKAFTASYPESLVMLAELHEFQRVLVQFNGESEVVLSAVEWAAVLSAVEKNPVETDLVSLFSKRTSLLDGLRVVQCSVNAGLISNASKFSFDLLKGSVVDKDWEFMSSVLRGDIPDLLKANERLSSWWSGNNKNLQVSLAKLLARRWDDSDMSESFCSDWRRFLKASYLSSDLAWQELISFAEVAACFERAGHHKDATSFYEKWLRLFPDEKNEISKRLLAIGWRDYDRQMLTKGQHGRARQMEINLRRQTAELKVSGRKSLPKFPEIPELSDPRPIQDVEGGNEVPPLPPTSSLPQGYSEWPNLISLKGDGFSIEYSRKHDRVKISWDSGDQLTYEVRAGALASDLPASIDEGVVRIDGLALIIGKNSDEDVFVEDGRLGVRYLLLRNRG